LNGIRGVIAPFAAVALYKWLNASGVSHLTFAVCFAVNVVGAAGFVLQWRGMHEKMAGFDRGSKPAIDENEPLTQIQASLDRGD
jgi:hypothetical protein